MYLKSRHVFKISLFMMVVLGIKPRASWMLSEWSTTELQTQTLNIFVTMKLAYSSQENCTELSEEQLQAPRSPLTIERKSLITFFPFAF